MYYVYDGDTLRAAQTYRQDALSYAGAGRIIAEGDYARGEICYGPNAVWVPDVRFPEIPPGCQVVSLRGYAHTWAVLNTKGDCIGWAPVSFEDSAADTGYLAEVWS